jgi:hypothetical protein
MISRVRRVLRQLREVAAELDYTERRLLEIRTGIPLTAETERALARTEIAELEALYARSDTYRELACDREPDTHEHSTSHPPAGR